MDIWLEWYRCVARLRPACSYSATYMWMVLALAGLCTRTEHLGVTSIIRALGLQERCYHRLLHMFHSRSLKLELLTKLWIELVRTLFRPLLVYGYYVLVVDGLKVAKEGKKMPAVKKLYQGSNDNSKPAYIFGHSFQVIALLVQSLSGAIFAVPLIPRIHEGLVFSNRDKRTLMDKLVEMFFGVTAVLNAKAILIADNYYNNRKVILPLLMKGMELISRIRSNGVGYFPAEPPKEKKRGRKKIYGEKVILIEFFDNISLFTTALSPVYGEKGILISYYCIDLLWRPIGRLARFVLVNHPVRGKIMLITTCLRLEPLKIIELYGYRFKIEVSFKHALHVVGTYSYHFWMKIMSPLPRKSGNQHLHRKSKEYREQVIRKITAYHCFVQLGCVTQGLLLHLSINLKDTVWNSFRSWLRTMNKSAHPSELVVTMALRSSLPGFLAGTPEIHALKKFISENTDPTLMPEWKLADTG